MCIKTKHVLRNDFTVAHNKKLYQILEPANTKDVIVEERINGSIHITHKNRALGFKEIYLRPNKEKVSRVGCAHQEIFGKTKLVGVAHPTKLTLLAWAAGG